MGDDRRRRRRAALVGGGRRLQDARGSAWPPRTLAPRRSARRRARRGRACGGRDTHPTHRPGVPKSRGGLGSRSGSVRAHGAQQHPHTPRGDRWGAEHGRRTGQVGVAEGLDHRGLVGPRPGHLGARCVLGLPDDADRGHGRRKVASLLPLHPPEFRHEQLLRQLLGRRFRCLGGLRAVVGPEMDALREQEHVPGAAGRSERRTQHRGSARVHAARRTSRPWPTAASARPPTTDVLL